MSADREQDHLDMMSGMIDRHHNQPYCYATTPEQDAAIEAKQVADDAARRTARASLENTKMALKALGVDLLAGLR